RPLETHGTGRTAGAARPAAAGASRQLQVRAVNGTSVWVVTGWPFTVPVTFTVAVPAGTVVRRVLKDWYAFLPGAVPVAVRVPYGVISSMVSGTVSLLRASTAT